MFINIEKKTKENKEYRKILYTDDNIQLIIQCLRPNQTVPFEVHENATQFIRCESGYGEITIGDKIYKMIDGFSVIIPKNTRHEIKNLSNDEDFKFYTIYGPKVH